MKNHWLNKKEDKQLEKSEREFLAAIEIFNRTGEIDLSAIVNETVEEKLKELDAEINKACEGAFLKTEFKESDIVELPGAQDLTNKDAPGFMDLSAFATKVIDKEIITDLKNYQKEREMVKEILLKHKHVPNWIDELLTEVGYKLPCNDLSCSMTITCADGVTYTHSLGNFQTTVTTGIPCGVPCSSFPTSPDNPCMSFTAGFAPDDPNAFGYVATNPNKDEAGFPSDDLNSLCQMSCGTANLDIWYGTPFIQNEKLQVLADLNTDVTQYQTMHTPVLAGTMTGTIYPTPGNTSYGFTFCVSSSGKFTFDRFVQDTDGNVEYASKQPKLSDEEWLEALANGEFDDRFMGWYDEAYVDGTTLNLQTGVLELHYHMGRQPEVIVSYEYNLDLEVGK